MLLGASLAMFGCKDEPAPAPAGDSSTGTIGSMSSGTTEAADGGSSSGGSGETGESPVEGAVVTHSFGSYAMAPHEEVLPCIQWTLHNEAPVYVQAVTIANDGGFHHSNWFVVPEAYAEGPDGFYDCSERGFTELEASVSGTVLTAQSTQSRFERMDLPPGVVVKVPPFHKIVAAGHLLNLANAEVETELRMSLDIIHPRDVEVVTAPFRLTYFDLDIPGFTEARFSGECDLESAYMTAAGGDPLDLKLYYVLPHYHYLGNYFDLTVLGGERDGESVFRVDGFNADASGQAFPEPVDLTGAQGFRFTCGFDNWTDQTVGWGIGDQEMCVMLGLADSRVLMDGSVSFGSGQVTGSEDGVLINEGPCGVLGLAKNSEQGPPTSEEIDGPLYVPPTQPGDVDLPPVDECEDTASDATPAGAATLGMVRDTLLVSSCQFSSCHGGSTASAGLDLTATDLHTELMEHVVQANTGLPLIDPGNPEGSWLYQLVSQCAPADDSGQAVAHMPLNAPRLADPSLVALLRDWIEAGAAND